MSKNVLEKIINNWIEYYFPEWWGGSSDLDIGAVNALIDMKLWDYDSLFSVTNWLYQILNSIDTEDEIWLSSWDTRAEIVADDTSMSLISHCYAVMCYIANSTVAMSTILADASATNEISECWNSITIIAESQLASDLYLASVNWITSLFTYQTAQDAFFTTTARKTQIVSDNLMVIVNDDTLLAQLNTDSVVQACIVNSTTALSTIAWDNDKLEIVKENTAIMNAIAVNSTALAAMSDSDFFEYILEDSTYLTTCAWSTNWKAKINSYAADDLLYPIYFWTGDLGYSTFAELAADDTSMEIVQANAQAMLIINSNDEAVSLLPWTVFYQKVEWIWNSWNQRIDTWLYPNSNWMVQMKFIYTSYGWWNLFWFNSDETNSFRFFRANDTTYLDYGSGSNYNRIMWTYITSTTDIYEVEFWNRYVKDIPTNTTKFSWSAVSFWNKNIKAYIFWNKENTDLMKLYYCKIYISWTLTREYIPCYRKSDNVIWMYDTVWGQFYTNVWSWNFTKWPNI